MAIVQIKDFLDNPVYDIAKTIQVDTQLSSLIDSIEKDKLQDLLGCNLYDLFIADLTASTPQIPQTQLFIDLFDEFCIDNNFCKRQKSQGIKDMLMAFIYFEWHRYNQNKSVANGIVLIDSENSHLANLASTNIYDKYNRGIESYQAIQFFIQENITIYPDFKGVKKEFATWI